MKVLSKDEMKKVMGGLEDPVDGGTSCAADCPAGEEAKITDCNGDCTGHTGYAECKGANNTLTKHCKPV